MAEVTQFLRGDVVLIFFRYPSEDGRTQEKRRPAVVISNRELNQQISDVLVVPLCRYDEGTTLPKYCIQVNMGSHEGKSAGLRVDSVIECSTIATIPKTMLVKKIGRFDERIMDLVAQCIQEITNKEPTEE